MSVPMNLASLSPSAVAADRSSRAFARLAEPYRAALRVHCYRMLGSIHDADDLVQETYLRAWRSFGSLDADAAVRPWLYRIATNACLDALAARRRIRRLLPDQRGPAATSPDLPDAPATELAWLEPFPDSEIELVADDAPGPEARYAAHEAVQLAFVAAIQQLPPRQRAALLLCDVMGWSAAEAAALLDASTASINSAVQRARDTLARDYPAGRPVSVPTPGPAQQDLLDRYLRAWEGHDLDGFVALLKADATYTMPPWLQWFAGRAAIRAFFAEAWKTCGGLRLRPTQANGQPAFAVYERTGPEARWLAHSLHVLTVEGEAIATLTAFLGPAAVPLFARFGLPEALTEKDC